MRATSGIFRWQADAERAARKLRSNGLQWSRVTLLVPGDAGEQVQRAPLSVAENWGVCKALGAVTGAAVGLAGGFELGAVVSAAVAGIGPVTAVGFWGAAIMGLVGVAVGAAAGTALDKALTDGLPEDKLLVHEDALRNGHSVVLAFTEDGDVIKFVRHILVEEGAEGIHEAPKRRWIGGRSSEQKQYST